MSERNEFSVVQYFPDDSYEYVRRYVSATEAMTAARHYCTSVGAKLGITKKVIITDGGDFICFEWTKEKGVTFPPLEGAKDGSEVHIAKQESAKPTKPELPRRR